MDSLVTWSTSERSACGRHAAGLVDDRAWKRRAPSDVTVGGNAAMNPKATTEDDPTPIAARLRGLLISACFDDRPSHQLIVGKIG